MNKIKIIISDFLDLLFGGEDEVNDEVQTEISDNRYSWVEIVFVVVVFGGLLSLLISISDVL